MKICVQMIINPAKTREICRFAYDTGNLRKSYDAYNTYTCNTTLFVKWWHDVIANDLIYDIVYNITLQNDRCICHGFSINSFDDTNFAIYLPDCPYKKNRNDYMCFFNMLGYHNVSYMSYV